jgi:hypothetical protein
MLPRFVARKKLVPDFGICHWQVPMSALATADYDASTTCKTDRVLRVVRTKFMGDCHNRS